MQPFQVDARLVARDDQEETVLAVLQEQVLRMSAGDRRLDGARFRDREHGRVLERLGGDAELVQEGEKIGGSGSGHAQTRRAPGF